jgi:hypothetical protein
VLAKKAIMIEFLCNLALSGLAAFIIVVRGATKQV